MSRHTVFPGRACAHACVVFLALAVSACTDPQQQPARDAIAEIEAAVEQSGTAPAKFVPGDLKEVQSRVDALKERFAARDYEAVLRQAPEVLESARELKSEAAAREVELLQSLKAEWNALLHSVPYDIAARRERVAALAGSAAPGASREALEHTRSRIEDAQVLWDRAVAEQTAQRLPEAVTLANQARELLERLPGLPEPAAAGGPVQ